MQYVGFSYIPGLRQEVHLYTWNDTIIHIVPFYPWSLVFDICNKS